ncbi:PAS domain-containing hybrid sensor histidine kinase/response regulator [Actinoplanes siamensis]|uniref:histidine kinase n=1 Tax=Actinoplanes siamensis TaxID=1223317 RepID=A0A919N403_9ACTN|nr:PAS domain S-box protein [Actinoplanes siamensis]GIF03914.1 hypothetical protein Asi03nite_14520 [Actinoplanes siamensis]
MATQDDRIGSEHAEAFLSSVVKSTADAIVGCDAQGRITAWNPAAERIYGYRSDEVRHRPVRMMYPDDVAERDWQVFQAALLGNPTNHLRTFRLRKDGARIPVRMSFAPIEGVDGSVRGVVSVAHELTDELRAEARMAALAQATPDAVICVNREDRITFANQSCERLLGYRPDELTGRSASTLFAEEVRGQMADLRRRLFADPRLRARTPTIATRMRRKDGVELPGETALSWLDDGPEDQILITATRDLSPLHRAESRLRALLEAVPDAITGIDRESRIVLANQGTERLLGRSRDLLLGKPYATLVPEGEREPIAQVVAAAFEEPHQVSRTVVYAPVIRADGTRVPTENTVTRFGAGDEDILLVVSRDISERVAAEQERTRLAEQVERQRTEQAILRAQRLEALGQLAGGVAHDFNNLLAIVSNYADLLGEEVADLAATDPRRWQPFADDLHRIQQAAQRGAALTAQLLTFSRRDLNQPQVLDPAAVIERLVPSLRTTLGEQYELRVDAAESLWPVVLDPGQLEQILVNLTVNARDAMPDGGLLHVIAGNAVFQQPDPAFQPDPEPGRRYLRLGVTDTGVGMPAEVAARAFDPFFTTKSKTPGAGLGLAAVYGIVGQAGGCLAVKSEPGAGTTMTVLLPATDQPAPTRTGDAGRDTAAVPPPQQRNILLVDDEEGVRESTARVLTRHGYRVLTAPDGSAALAVAERHRENLDVLLTDVIMPQMHGGELAQRVTRLIPTIKVIFMSGYAEPLLDTGPPDPARVYLTKPFTIPDLLRAVQSQVPA